jgi:AraC-like DNA-binding protein
VRPDQIFAFRPNGDATSAPDTADPWPYALVAMPFETLAMAAAQLRVKRPVALNDDTLIDTGGRAMARLRGLVADAAHIAQEKPWLAPMPDPARALSGTILEALLDCFRDGQAFADRPARHRRRTVIGRLIETARFAPERLLSLPDICAICGVPPRTLNLVCQEFLGVSAMRYARLRRLDHARERLLCGGTDAEGVTGVATALGFWELGRFASAYRARFGETPSETLRRGEVR